MKDVWWIIVVKMDAKKTFKQRNGSFKISSRDSMTRDGEGQGHYICDVKAKDNQWYKTNDNDSPVQISRQHVSKKSAVVLYRKCETL